MGWYGLELCGGDWVVLGSVTRLAVLITGDKQAEVDMAARMIENLLKTSEEVRNEHKKMQLRELAALNGTLKEVEDKCLLCGDVSHKSFECPKATLDLYKLPDQLQKKVRLRGRGGDCLRACPTVANRTLC